MLIIFIILLFLIVKNLEILMRFLNKKQFQISSNNSIGEFEDLQEINN